jgi:predicted DNA-binding protein
MKTERMTFLLTPEVKATITSLAGRMNIPTSELVRRAIDAYDPELDDAVLSALADELQSATKATDRTLDEALASVKDTLAHLRERRDGEAA